MYKVAYIGNSIDTPEYLYFDGGFEIEFIICEKKKLNEELLSFALIRGIKLYEVSSKNQINEIIRRHNEIDFYIMSIFGIIISAESLKLKKIYNIHPSYLPYYKGSHPTFWAIMNNEKYLGISLHEVTEKIDAGQIISRKKVHNYYYKNESELLNELYKKIPDLLKDFKKYLKKKIKPIKNIEGFYDRPVNENDLTIFLEKDNPEAIYNKVKTQYRFRGAKLEIDGKNIWIKNFKFVKSEKNIYDGGIYEEKKNKYIKYKKNVAIKLIEYSIEKK
jgi:methionyl-tRNA formyltransferase